MNFASHKRLWLLLAILLVAISGLVWKWSRSRPPLATGVAISGGVAMEQRITVPLFKQWNPTWSEQSLGTTGSPMRSFGCTVCSLAMALSSKGFPFDPGNLNGQLAANQAFTRDGLLIWSGVKAITQGRLQAHLDNRPTHQVIDAQIAAGNPVIAKVLYDDRIWHWVLITGKSATDYLIHDPLSTGAAYERMSAYPRGIYAIRYLESR